MGAQRWYRWVLSLWVFSLSKSSSVGKETVHTDCGGILQEPRGVISSPNFPNRYPIPISCRWVIEAPAEKVIAVYFTQYYMKEGLRVTEYAFFSDTMYMGKTEIDPIIADREPTYFVSSKPILVMEFVVREEGNIHLRVREYFLDIFGFNITYEIIDKKETIRTDGCIYHHCSYAGICYATSDYRNYYCDCFNSYYGQECQFSPICGPSQPENFCQNGGTCRHHIGSHIHTCECPPNFKGLQCDERKEDISTFGCNKHGCSHSCIVTENENVECTCPPGYRLDDDIKSCIQKGRIRFLISFKISDPKVEFIHTDNTKYKQFKRGIENALLQLFKPQLLRVDNLTLLGFQPTAVAQFHFFGEKEDRQKVKEIMEEALKRGTIGRYSVDYNYIQFEWQPALSIQNLEPSENMPVIEGTEFSIACIMQGSSALQVHWYKDDKPINIHSSYRHMWTNLVPKNSKQQYTALLGFDQTNILDSGIFTCEVSDWGSVQNQSIAVTITSVPKPKVFPLTATVLEGSNLIITCLSAEDIFGKFGYNWLKNGKILNPTSEPELIEDLYPTGSRVLVKHTTSSTTYTCIITSTAGATHKDSVITVINKDGKIPTCSTEVYMMVNWTMAAANTEDVHPCPAGYTGEAKRMCILKKESGAVWEKPNFSGCLSREFVAVKRKFNSLELGYQVTDIGSVMYELKGYLYSKKPRYHVGEGEPVVDLLEDILSYQQQHIAHYAEMHNNSKVFLDIVSLLLESPNLIQKQSQIMKLHQLVLNYGLLEGAYTIEESFVTHERYALVMEVGHVQNEGRHTLTFPTSRSPKVRKKDVLLPVWLTDSVELDFNTWLMQDLHEGNNSISIAVVFYKNLSAFLPERLLDRQGGQDMEYQLHSRLVSVAMQAGEHKLGTKSTNLVVKARLAHFNQTTNHQIVWNISCGMADFSQSVKFSMEGCQPVHNENYSICQCNHAGTYAVLLTTYAQSDDFHIHEGFDIVAGIGCAICAFLVFFSLLALLVLWRHIKGAITALKIQVCLALLGAYATVMTALSDMLHEKYYPHVVSLIQFFLLAAFCMQLCLGLTVYTELVDLRNVRYLELIITTMGWAVPMIVVGATLAAQVLEGFSLESWWLKVHTNYFYAYVTSVLAISLFQILLFLTVKAELRCNLKDPLKHNKLKNRSRLLHRSLIISGALLTVSLSSILYINFGDNVFKYFFSLCSAFLGIVVFGCYTVCSENPYSLCSSDHATDEEGEKHEPRMRSRSNSFKSFLKPEVRGEIYCTNRLEESANPERRSEKTRWIRSQFPKASLTMEEKEADYLLKRKCKNPVEDATVHDFRNKQGKENSSCNNSDSEGGFQDFDDEHTPPSFRRMWRKHRQNPHSPPFELQELEGSPRNSQFHIQDLDEMISEGEQESLYDYGSHPLGANSIVLTHSTNSSPSCQLLLPPSSVKFSDMSESGSSQSSGLDEHSAFASSGSLRASHYNPYRPSSLLQFETLVIREEDEMEIISEDKLNSSPEKQQIYYPENVPLRIIPGKADCDNNENSPETVVVKRSPPKDSLIREHPSEMDMRVMGNGCEAQSIDEQSSQSKKGWSITTV